VRYRLADFFAGHLRLCASHSDKGENVVFLDLSMNAILMKSIIFSKMAILKSLRFVSTTTGRALRALRCFRATPHVTRRPFTSPRYRAGSSFGRRAQRNFRSI